MTRRQTAFTQEGLTPLPDGFTREDLVLMEKLKLVKALCPYCLYYGDLWEFTTFLKQKRGKHMISPSKCRCPDCMVGYMKKTLLKVDNMFMEEFAYWFWGSMFGERGGDDRKWSSGDKVSWDKFMRRLKGHFSREDKEIFWDVYWEFKDAKDTGQTMEDREAFEDYKRSYEGLK